MGDGAGVAELADALDSKSCGRKGRVGSIPTFGNRLFPYEMDIDRFE